MKQTLQIQNRRGVTLLFVVSMIVLFLLMGTTFVVVSRDFLRSSVQRTRITVSDINTVGENRGERFIREALYDLVRGPDLNNSNSPLRGHSILGDMYGYGFVGYVRNIEDRLIQAPSAGATSANSPQFVRVELIGTALSDGSFDTRTIGNDVLSGFPLKTGLLASEIAPTGTLPPYKLVPTTPGRFNGQLLTFTTGAARGVTARIVDHQIFAIKDPAVSGEINYEHSFVLMLLNPNSTIQNGNLTNLIGSYNVDPNQAARVVVNGRPFAGTGAGIFDPNNALSALTYPPARVNQVGNSRQQMWSNTMSRRQISGATGIAVPNEYSVNENYDAVDMQNMFLASDGDDPIFSFGARAGVTNAFYGDINLYDFDGDGDADANFIDIGLAPYTNNKGRLIQPLVAYRVLDLDSKININVHGNRSQVAANNRFLSSLPVNTGLGSGFMAPGEGFGPAEIRLNAVFNQAVGGGATEADRLMVGDMTTLGRYGADSDNAGSSIQGGGPVPGFSGRDPFSAYKLFGYPDVAGNGGIVGGLFWSRPMDIYGRFFTGYPNPMPGDNFTRSMPFADINQSTLAYREIINNPYETHFGMGNSLYGNFDSLFTLEELERIYRQDDIPDFVGTSESSSRLGRLADLAPSLRGANRFSFTTDSWEVPALHQEFIRRDLANPNSDGELETIVGKLYTLLRIGNDGTNPNQLGIRQPINSVDDFIMREQAILANITGYTHELNGSNIPVNSPRRPLLLDAFTIGGPEYSRGMISSDLRMGIPMDINRPFGDGVDNNNNGVVDEPFETDNRRLHPNGNAVAFDYDNNGVVNGDGTVNRPSISKQLFARQLYVLMLLASEVVDRDGDGRLVQRIGPDATELDNNDFNFDIDGDNDSDNDDRIAFRRIIAQWAINVVDFRDPDSIMTPFEFDTNPFDGWDADGDLTTTGGQQEVVWGAERPELLITETVSIHDRRTNDSTDDPSGEETAALGNGGTDEDTDSQMVPVASAFFELYNPWLTETGSAQQQIASGEFDPTGTGAVDLAETDPNGNPVWRMKVVLGTQNYNGPVVAGGNNIFEPFQDPDTDPNPQPALRYVYFSQPQVGDLASEGIQQQIVYLPDNSISGPQRLFPGQRAVVGSRGIETAGGVFRTYLGRKTGLSDGYDTNTPPDEATLQLDMTRRIELDPNANTVTSITGFGDATANDPATDPVLVIPMEGPLSLAAGSRRSLGLSDPSEGYSTVIGDPAIEVRNDGDFGPYLYDTNVGMRVTVDVPLDAQVPGNPINNMVVLEDGLYSSMYAVTLQRLANPEQGFDPVTNPYRTVDSTSVDLFAFNSFEDDSEPADLYDTELYFGSFERRSNIANSTTFGQGTNGRFRMLWKTDYNGLDPTGPSMSPVPPNDHIFERDFMNTLGRPNLAYENAPAGQPNNLPFAWLTWNNRPYASAYELTLVPFTSSYFLTNRFDTSMVLSQILNSPYETAPAINDISNPTNQELAYRYSPVSGEYPHLLNFHADGGSFGFHRLFDYVEVPSRYTGTETYMNPTTFFDPSQNNTNNVRSQMSQAFAPPFDYVPNYRYPGKVNLNTITDGRVWNAIMGEYGTPQKITFKDWRASMESGPGNNPDRVDNPLRANGTVSYVSSNPNDNSEAGLFRKNSMGNQSLFDHQPGNGDNLQLANRSAYYRYHARNRIGNMVTNRSSVFAIWIAIKYFEVVDGVNGAGVETTRLTTEFVDEKTGASEVNEGFFILDRSIPVAFEPGKNHNVDRAIRVSSFIK